MAVRDSAGIRIVEHSAAALEQLSELTVAAEPSVTIGASADSADDLNEVVGGYLAPTGEIVFADQPAFEIRIHAADGSRLRSLGRRGSGPGEFSGIASIWRRGDSTAVYDISAKRLTVAPNDGSAPRIATIRSSGYLQRMQGSADGRLVTRQVEADALLAVEAASTRIPEFVRVISPDGSSTDTILTIPGPPLYQHSGSPGFDGPAPLGLGPQSEMVVVGDSVVIGTNTSFELTTYDLDGRPVRIVRVATPALPIQEADIELARQKAWEEFEPLSRGMPEKMSSDYRKFLEDQRYAEHLPYYGKLAADPAGNLWVQEYPRPGDSEERFTIFSGEGGLVARVRLPPGLHLLAAGDDAILGVWRDADGVEQVRVHALSRNQGRVTRPASDTLRAAAYPPVRSPSIPPDTSRAGTRPRHSG